MQMDYEYAEQVKSELQFGETLLFCEKTPSNVGGGIFLMLLGGVPMIIYTIFTVSILIDNMGVYTTGETLIVYVIIMLFLSIFFKPGYDQAVVRRKDYVFITDRRLCIRRNHTFGRRKDRDIPAASIENVYKVRVRRGIYDAARVKVKGEKHEIGFVIKHNSDIFNAVKQIIQ